jgi:ribosomal protein S18 acetylase RimI-like enzyme
MPERVQTSVMRLAKDQVAQATAVLSRAFQEYPLIRFTIPNAARRPAATAALHDVVIRYCLRHGEVYTTPEVAGAACWLPPDQPFPTLFRMLRAGMHRVPFRFGWSGSLRLRAVDTLAQQLHRTHVPGPHWYLWLIGVDPEHQGKGVAAQLVQPVVQRADADHLPCYLETHKEMNVSIYQRLGFTVAQRVELPMRSGSMWGMLRPPA